MADKTKEFLLDQCTRYPALRPGDLLKALHQSVFGCGHFVKANEFLKNNGAEPIDWSL